MKKSVLTLLAIVCFCVGFSQEEEVQPDYGIKFSGFVKSDFFYDSRQVYSVRDRHFVFMPMEVVEDANGDDIYANSSLNFLAIQSRLKGTITGPNAFGAKTLGVLEADFFGNAPNIFRLRHAFVKLNWTSTELLLGQYWHPIFVTSCFPGTVSFNTGVPFNPFSRNPQARFTFSTGDLKLMAVASTQRDFASPGGTIALSNSGMPDMTFQVQFDNQTLFAGGSFGFKSLKPSLTDINGNTTDEMVSGIYLSGFLKANVDVVTVKFSGIYGQNMHDVLMTNGYAYSTYNAATGEIAYTPISNFSIWTDIHTNAKAMQFGFFAGYMQNLGATDDIVFATFTRHNNANLDYLFRVSPRVIFNSGKTRFAGELEYTGAAYATRDSGVLNIDSKGKVTDSEVVGNVRLLFSAYYFF